MSYMDETTNGRPAPQKELSLWILAAMVLRKWRLGVAAATAIAVLGVALVFALGSRRVYTTGASFVPQAVGPQGGSGLAMLAAQYGVAVGSQGAESPQFYADLLRARRTLTRVGSLPYTLATDSGSAPVQLQSFATREQQSPGLAEEAVVRWLHDRVNVQVKRETGVVEFSVSAPRPELAQQIAAALLAELHDYNVTRRQSRAAAERRFVEERLTEARTALFQAEERLESFMVQNRQFRNSPELQLTYDRLQRDAVMKQTLATSLAESAEQAKIEEVRNTPVVSVIEEPQLPNRPDPRGRIRKSILVLFLAGIAGLLIAFIAAVLERDRQLDESGYREFESVWADLRRGLRPGRRSGRTTAPS